MLHPSIRFFAAALIAGAPLASAFAATPVAPLAYTTRTLANGLRVYAIRDTATANVAIQVWYDVGSKDDPAGRSGFAHMFEHMMFKATRNMRPEQMDRLTEDVGGDNNASTDDDYTEYHETVPANHLERLIWAEAERMGALVVRPETFASEREVVKEELRTGLARPYGPLFQRLIPQASYSVLPYARPGIGNIAELDAATVDEARAFHAVYYRPDNAVLVVAGNFDPAQLDRWIDRYFGPIATPNRPIPRVAAKEPPRAGPQSYIVHAANTPLPAVVVSWLAPPSRHRDHAAFSVMEAILSAGESSRLYESLVYREQLAQEADTVSDIKQDTGTFTALAIMAGGKDVAAGEVALRREIGRLRDAPVTAAELAEARNQIVTSVLRSRETPYGKASTLGRAVVIDGDPKAADRRLAEIERVTAADIQRVARAWLPDDKRVVIRYLPGAPAATDDAVPIRPTVVTAPLVAPADVKIVLPASDAERVAPPGPTRPVPITLPKPYDTRLENGLRVIVAERPGLPLVSAVLTVDGGAAADPDARAGLAAMTAGLLTKGTTTRSATDIAGQIEALGGSIGAGAGWDSQSLSMTVKSDQFAPAMAIFADVARNPVFAAAEVERLRTQEIDDLGIAYSTPGTLARLVAARAVFGTGAYGHPASGTLASLKAMTQAEIAAAYRAAWRPDAATLILAGDITREQGVRLAERLFFDWRAPAAPRLPATAANPVPAPRLIVVDLPQAAQAAVAVARQAIARADPRYYPAVVANTTLGGGFSSRLNAEVRIKRGLAYGAGSNLDARRVPGPFLAITQTKNPSVPEVIELILAEMRRLGREPVTAAELATRKAVLQGGFGRTVETVAGVAGLVASVVADGVPLEEIQRYSGAIEAVSPAALQAAAAALMDPGPASIVVVGDARQFLPALQAKGLKPEVVPVAALKLDTPALK